MPDTISVVCPACGARMKAPASMAGKTARCPKCKHALVVAGDRPEVGLADNYAVSPPDRDPAPLGSAARRLPAQAPGENRSPAAEANPHAVSARCRACGERYEVSGDLAGKFIKCRGCGERLQVPGLPPDEPSQSTTRTDAAGPEVPRVSGLNWGTLAGLGVVGVVVVVAVANLSKPTTPPLPAAPASSNPPPPSPAVQARQKFEQVFGRVNKGLGGVEEEDLPPTHQFDWDINSSFELTAAGKLGPDILPTTTYDVRETGSLVTPYKGVIGFGAQAKLRVTGRLDNGRTRHGYTLLVDVNYAGEAEYGFADGRWRLTGVRLTRTKCWAQSAEPLEKNLPAALLANEVNQGKAAVTSKVVQLGPDTNVALVKFLREAAAD